MPTFPRASLVRLASLLLAAGCALAPAAAQETPVVPVSAVEVVPEAIPIINELPGRIAPTRIAEVRPRISGILVERVFEQGSLVEEGDVLYRIDPAPFQVQVDRARATLQSAEAARLQAAQQEQRQQDLRERQVSSEMAYEIAVANLAQADADVAVARAGLAAAQLDLEYSEIRAPISGRIGRALITEGALVSPTSAESLATVQQLDPVYADFTQSARDLLALRRSLDLGALTDPNPGEAPVRLKLDDGSNYAHVGRLLFAEAAVDATTGQVTLRAEFPNPDGDLLPGLYVRVLVEQGVDRNALAVPLQAIQRDLGGRAQLFVVNNEDVVELKSVRLGREADDRVIVTEGLEAGERVIVEGFQKIQPGSRVSPQPWDSPTNGRASSSASPTVAQ